MPVLSLTPMTFLDSLVETIRQAGMYDKADQTPPAAILWTDKERHWEALIPALRSQLPLLTLGSYGPQHRTGSAYWIRCMIARTLADDVIPGDVVPVIYLPGVSRADIRAIEECPPELQPLAELQYRGVLFTQKNGHDWTPSAFLQTKSGGLGLEVAGDQATKDALKRALVKLADESVERLRKEIPLKATFFDALLTPDEARSLLLWLNDPAAYRLKTNPEEWLSFCSVCKAKYKFHPEADGPITAAQLLGFQEGNWKQIWTRFKESPRAYPNLPGLMRAARLPQPDLFDISESWPQDNETAEEQLQQRLDTLGTLSVQDARLTLADMEQQHGARREWVWAALGFSPLAQALEPLSTLASLSAKPLVGAKVVEIAQAYLEWGWKVDQAVLDALELIQRPGNSIEAIRTVKGAILAVYKPWLEAAANTMQKAITSGPVGSTYPYEAFKKPEKGTCVLFSDALRLDVGQKLASALIYKGYLVKVTSRLAALPPVTSTAKFSFATDLAKISGVNSDSLTPHLAGKESPITAEVFRKLLEDAGFHILRGEDLGDPSGLAWTEAGEIDAYGHEHACKLAVHIPGELYALRDRIETLLSYGWKKVIVVTDHGWLLLPGGLPKVALSEGLTDLRKGRCARIKDGALVDDQQIVPWFWDKDVRISEAPGIYCYEAGKEYEHGGLSPQECITPVLEVMKNGGESETPVTIEAMKWRGMRFSAKIGGAKSGMIIDIREKAGDATTSIVTATASPVENGEVSLIIEDEDKQGTAVFVVALTAAGLVCAQTLTIIGE